MRAGPENFFWNSGLFCAGGAEILNKFSASPSSKKLSFR